MPKKIQEVVLASDPEEAALLIREELIRCGVALESLVGELNLGLKRGGEPPHPAPAQADQSPSRLVFPENRGQKGKAKCKKRPTPT